MSKSLKKSNTRWPLVVYDVIVYIIASILLLWIYGGAYDGKMVRV